MMFFIHYSGPQAPPMGMGPGPRMMPPMGPQGGMAFQGPQMGQAPMGQMDQTNMVIFFFNFTGSDC